MDGKAITTKRDLEHILLDERMEAKRLSLSLLKTITNNFSHEIGHGGFAKVYKGGLEYTEVAVKKLSQNCFDEEKFIAEVQCLMKAKHKNIVRFLGYCSETEGEIVEYNEKFVMADVVRQRLLCFEYVPNKSLKDYIKDASRDWKKCYKIIKGVCEGLHYLHKERIVHRDLTLANILLDNDMVPKITDFGISTCFDELQTHDFTSKRVGTVGYLAPEFICNGKITLKSDIYSLGTIITEILTGHRGCLEVEEVEKHWSHKLEGSQKELQLEQIRVCTEVAQRCWEFKPEDRPSAEEIIDILKQTEIEEPCIEPGASSHGPRSLDVHGRDCSKSDGIADAAAPLGSTVAATNMSKRKRQQPQPPNSENGRFSYGVASSPGKRASMENFYEVRIDDVDGEKVGMFGVYDGHGGVRAAEYVKQNLFSNLIKHPKFITDTKVAIAEAYNHTDSEFLEADSSQTPVAGSTASTAIIVGDRLLVANVGDSRAVISKGGQAIAVSRDHKPYQTDERQRIEDAGGFVMWAGTWRVCGILPVSRSFGDKLLKQYVVVDPEIKEVVVDSSLEFLILASGGLWVVVTNEEAVAMVKPIQDPQEAANKLLEEASRRGSSDNITVVIVRFLDGTTATGDTSREGKETTKMLMQAISKVYAGEAKDMIFIFKELYSGAYNLVIHNKGGELYFAVETTMASEVQSLCKPLDDAAPMDSTLFLQELLSKWDRHIWALQLIRDLFMYMERCFIPTNGKTPIYELGLRLWRDEMARSNKIRPRLIEVVKRQKGGEDELVAAVNKMHTKLGLKNTAIWGFRELFGVPDETNGACN